VTLRLLNHHFGPPPIPMSGPTRLNIVSPAPTDVLVNAPTSCNVTPSASGNVTPQDSRRAAVMARMARKSKEKAEVPITSMERLRRKFAAFDANGDGTLTRQEIYDILTRPSVEGSRAFNTRMFDEFVLFFNFSKIDKNGDGVVDIDEFVDALLSTEARKVFGQFDPRGSGIVSTEQLPNMFAEFSMTTAKRPEFSKVYAKAVVDEGFDGDAGSVLDCDRFLRITRKVSKELKEFETAAADKAAVEAAGAEVAARREEQEKKQAMEKQTRPKLRPKQKKLSLDLEGASLAVSKRFTYAKDLMAMSKPSSRSTREKRLSSRPRLATV